MAGLFSHTVVQGWMDTIAATPVYMGICSSDPLAVSDPLSVETGGGTYARALSTWTRTAANVMTINAGVTIRGLQAGSVVAAVAGWDSAFGGNLIFSDLLTVPVSYPVGGTYVIPAGDYVIGIDIAGS